MNNKEALKKLKELVGIKLSFDTPTPAPKPEPAAKPKVHRSRSQQDPLTSRIFC